MRTFASEGATLRTSSATRRMPGDSPIIAPVRPRLAQAPLQERVLAPHPPLGERALDRVQEVVVVERLDDVVDRAVAQRLDRALHRRVARHQDDRQLAVELAQGADRVEPGRVRQLQVGDDEVDRRRVHRAQPVADRAQPCRRGSPRRRGAAARPRENPGSSSITRIRSRRLTSIRSPARFMTSAAGSSIRKQAPPARIVLRAQVAAELVHDLARDREAEPGAGAVLGREERLEDAPEVLRRDPRPLVADRERDARARAARLRRRSGRGRPSPARRSAGC